MIHQRLLEELEEVARRFRRLYVWTTLSASWFVVALAGLALLVRSTRAGSTSAWLSPLLALVAVATTVLGVLFALRRARDPHRIARRIEAGHPELKTKLLAAIEQKPNLPDGNFGYLQHVVILDALAHGRRSGWQELVPNRRIRVMQFVSLVALVLLVTVLGQISGQASPHRTPLVPLGPLPEEPAEVSYEVTIVPGDTELERGRTLIVTAEFTGPLPDDAALVYSDAPGETVRSPMSLSLSDPIFGGRVATVQNDLAYHVEYAGETTREYRVTVYEHPQLERADVQLVFPAFTALGDKFIEDTRRVTAVEGTELTLLCRLNKPVVEAYLLATDGSEIELAPRADDATLYTMTLRLAESARYRLHLTDADGRANKKPPEFVFNVTRNRPADVHVNIPARDMRVSPIEELDTQATLWDDYGLASYGISYGLAGDPPREVVISEQATSVQPTTRVQPTTSGRQGMRGQRGTGGQRGIGGRQPVEGQGVEVPYLIDFESLQAEPDRLASYYFWAEDFGPDGEPRRTFSDMYFAEVRHFEEIFRQGQQPTAGEMEQQERERQQRERMEQEDQGGEQGQEMGDMTPSERAEQLAEQQKQIINATWAVIRREIESEPTDQFATDSQQLQTAQQEALDRAASLGEDVADTESEQLVEDVQQGMTEALSQLTEAADSMSADPLHPALVAEQAAYQALLRLRAREYEVIQQNRGQQQGQRGQRGQRGQQQQQQQRQRGTASGPQSRAQQQLNQLELNNQPNRYETERQAQAQQEQRQQQQQQQEQETREALNRLRELARRQSDVNQRARELQSALEEAQTQQQRQEIERQLQRLREQQQQILRDTDELAQQMQQPQNQQRMAESRRNLEQTRENIRQTTEALREGQMSQAIASGTRAERQLEEMREEFRRQAADRFSEEARQLRDDARQLSQNENQLAERLRNFNQEAASQPEGLRDSQERQDIGQGFQQQTEDLNRLLENMQRTIEEAEETEPLMTERLYDTLRTTRQQRLEDALDVTRELVDRGFVREARSAEEVANQGIEQLREGVEEAAEGVLGDEEAALRRARDMLTELSDQLNEEMRRAQRPESRERPGEQQPGEQQAGQRRAGQQQPGQQQPGEQQAGQRRAGQQQPGQQQPGEQQAGQRRAGQQQPGEQQPGQMQPGEQQPGQMQPGQQQPGEQQPGQMQRGQMQPGEQQPGQMQPGQMQPGQQQPGEQQPGQMQPGQMQPGQQQPGERQPGQQQPGQMQPGQMQPGQRQGGGQPGQQGPEEQQLPEGLLPPELAGWTPGEEIRGPEEETEPPENAIGGGGQPRDEETEPPENAMGGGGGRPRDDMEEPQRARGPDTSAQPGVPRGPMTGTGFIRWSEELRDVEEMLEDPQMRSEAARIRDEAEAIRRDMRDSFRGPNWDLVHDFVAEPLNELRDRVAEELLRRGDQESMVPIDRDPVPPKYADEVRRYYEQLGSGW